MIVSQIMIVYIYTTQESISMLYELKQYITSFPKKININFDLCQENQLKTENKI